MTTTANTGGMAKSGKKPSDLTGLLDVIGEAAEGTGEVTFDDLLDAIGRRSFGPLLLLCGLIIVAPVVGDIPGVPTSVGLVVVLVCGQLLIGRDQFWFPGWVRRRSITKVKVRKMVRKTRKPARWVDKLIRPRLAMFVEGAGHYVIAALSVSVALVTPVMEVVPFSANLAGAILAAFGLAMIARDGVLAIIALVLLIPTVWLVVSSLLG